MRYRPASVMTLVLAVSLYFPGRVIAAPGQKLIVTPSAAHPGGLLYLSGSGFAPQQKLPLAYSCGSGHSASSGSLGTGSRADGKGRFAGFAFHAPDGAASGSTCQVWAANTPSGNFTILAATRPLPTCAQHMCVKVRAFLNRIRSGAWGYVVIVGWPGSRVTATVFRIGKDKHRRLRLNWRGVGSFKVWVAPGLIKGLRASVRAHAVLGHASGSGTSSFAVIPGGR